MSQEPYTIFGIRIKFDNRRINSWNINIFEQDQVNMKGKTKLNVHCENIENAKAIGFFVKSILQLSRSEIWAILLVFGIFSP